MTVAQLKALRAAALVMLDIEGSRAIPDAMRRHAGERWRIVLRKALAEISGELAHKTFGKGGKRA